MTQAASDPTSADQFPVLPGYLSVARVAELFGMAKASIYYKIYEQKRFTRVYRIPGASRNRPVLVLLESEVMEVLAQERAVPQPSAQQRLAEWNRRVKQWGRENGWAQQVHVAGQPPLGLCAQYLRENPHDVRP